jgi:hypothetical protein
MMKDPWVVGQFTNPLMSRTLWITSEISTYQQDLHLKIPFTSIKIVKNLKIVMKISSPLSTYKTTINTTLKHVHIDQCHIMQ